MVRNEVATKRKLEPTASDTAQPVKKRGRGRPKKIREPAPEPEVPSEVVTKPSVIEPETTLFLQLLEDDTRLLPPPPPPITKRKGHSNSVTGQRVVDFELPFKEAEIKTLEERQWVRRPPPFGKINRCVYVSTTMPIADLPVHKCTCFEEIHKSTTKRTTQMASAKAKKEAESSGEQALENKQATVYCGEGCYNRMLFISCSDETCSAPDPSLCSNRAIKRRELKSVHVEYIPGPGFGLIANEEIKAGEFIVEYVGEVIDDEECERRMIKSRDNGEGLLDQINFYMMELEKNIVIDAKYRSNDSRFINHCCDPNSVTQKWNVDGMQRIGIFARRNIVPGEEITIDYNFSHFGEAVQCKCGSTACTGKIGLKRSKLPAFNPRVAITTKTKKVETVDEPPPELKRPVHLSSLALLKSAQLDESWLDYFGFKNRRLFIGHNRRRSEKADQAPPTRIDGNTDRRSLLSSSPASECSTTTEEDVSLTPPQVNQSTFIAEKRSRKSNWYEKVIAGDHLPAMRALHSYICGGKADWTEDLLNPPPYAPLPVKKRGPGRPPKKPKVILPLALPTPLPKRVPLGTKLIRKRLSLSEARSRGVKDIIAFANGKSKWNKRIPSSSSIDPDRINRFIDHVKDGQIFVNTDLNDLNEDTCYRCGQPGELICCDGCPAAFHLCCTSLAMVPRDDTPWFCSECTNPKHLQKGSEESASGVAASRGTRSSSRVRECTQAGRQLRTHSASQAPSLKQIFHASKSKGRVKRRHYKKRQRAMDRSYRMLEHMPLPAWTESDASEGEAEVAVQP